MVGGLTVVAYISISCVFSYMVLLRTIQSIWIYDYDYDYDYDQMFCSHLQLQYIIHLCIAPEYLMVLIGESTAVVYISMSGVFHIWFCFHYM